MQDWTGLLEYYRLWQDQNGKGRKKREPKTKLGKAMKDGYVAGHIYAFLFCIVIITVITVVIGYIDYKDGNMDFVIFWAVVNLVCNAPMIWMIYILVNKDKHPKTANVLLYGKKDPWDKRKRK
ncbi:MAG: hypothetical protein IJC91_07390, partial [Oscillospiraceae bacterium]|nr:hypothetical protein [Oscillospiraceae bacterium]